MPTTKNALIRYKVLDRCLSNRGRQFDIHALRDEINKAIKEFDPGSKGIAKRQVYYDLNFMQSDIGYSAPIEKYKEGRRTFYYYEDHDFSIDKRPLREEEANQIRSALLILQRFSGTEQFRWVNELIPKLEQAFNLRQDTNEIIGFDSNIDLQGLEHIEGLFKAIYHDKAIKVSYRPFTVDEPSTFIFHPYYLKQYNNRWFLFGVTDGNFNPVELTILALDRILGFKETDAVFFPNNTFNPVDYFEEIIGVSRPRGEESIKIELAFTPRQAPYILTKPIHGSLKVIKNDENGLVISIDVIPNFELDRLIMSFGDSIEVISPHSYRQMIQAKHRSAYKIYK